MEKMTGCYPLQNKLHYNGLMTDLNLTNPLPLSIKLGGRGFSLLEYRSS